MILSELQISELRKWLVAWNKEIKTQFPSLRCTCEICCLVRDTGVAKVPLTPTCAFILAYKALALHDRFGQCDLNLLKELYEKEVAEADG